MKIASFPLPSVYKVPGLKDILSLPDFWKEGNNFCIGNYLKTLLPEPTHVYTQAFVQKKPLLCKGER